MACRLPGFVLMKPRSLTIKRGETTTCRLTMRPSMVTHALEGASVELIGGTAGYHCGNRGSGPDVYTIQ